jgi:glycosyltransferase involved in cell wall biosynthesis
MKPKILLLSDDIRSVSGVARISKDLVLNTVDRFDWVQIAAKRTPENTGQIIDVSESVTSITGVSDANVKLYSNAGYGDEMTLNRVLEMESPSAILHITDPRYWSWLYGMETQIRTHIPICYYHVWDNDPAPKFNEGAYKSCDWIGCISNLTYNLVKEVDTEREEWQTEYIPHGSCPNTFFPMNTEDLVQFKQSVCNNKEYDFIVLSNNVNISRKQLPTIISAYSKFGDTLDSVSASKILLLLHTDPDFQGGSDLRNLANSICPKYDIAFSNVILDDVKLNSMYNIADVTINVASNEGFGLSTLESMFTGTPIIISKTGGLVDQVTQPSGLIGEWSSAIEPKTRNLTGSQVVPYIYSDLCNEDDIVSAIKYWHDMNPEDRINKGISGREYAQTNLNTKLMCGRVADGITRTIENFKPRSRINLIKI